MEWIQKIAHNLTGNYALQLDNEEGGIQRVFTIIVTQSIISDAASLWFFALFFFACILLVLNRFSSLSFKSKPVTV